MTQDRDRGSAQEPRPVEAQRKQGRIRRRGTDDIAQMDPVQRQRVGAIWADRARSELGAGSGFARVVVHLYDLGARAEVVGLATRASAEEVEHALACRDLAELYLGEPVTMPTPKRIGMPPHRGADDRVRAALHVIGLCCFSETIAVEFMGRQLDASTFEAVRASSSAHLRDEIGHARVGWAHLGSDCHDRKEKRELSRWLARMLRANVEHWLSRIALLPEEGVAGHGYAPRQHFREGVFKACTEVIVPGFDAVGLDAKGAARELRLLM